MNPCNSNRGDRKAQEPLGRGHASSQDCPRGCQFQARGPTQDGFVKLAYQYFVWLFDTTWVTLDDQGRQNLAGTLLPRLVQLAAFLEKYHGTRPEGETGPPCDSRGRREECRRPLDSSGPHRHSHPLGAFNRGSRRRIAFDKVGTPPQAIERGENDREVSLSPGDKWMTGSEAAQLIGRHRGVISRWASQGKIVDNGLRGRERRVLRSSVLLLNQDIDDEHLQRDARDLRADAGAIPDSHS